MSNDELKKKIVEVLKPVIRAGNISCNEENACKKCWFPCEIARTAGRLADALIAAGIGDVKESENKATAAELVAQAAASTAIKKIAEWKHRAEVAEKALYNACKHFCQFIVPCPNNDCKRIFCNKQKYGCYHEYFLQKAEKELAEEGKDANKTD